MTTGIRLAPVCLRKALSEIERTWVTQLERGQESGAFRADLDARLTYRLLRDVLWIPSQRRELVARICGPRS